MRMKRHIRIKREYIKLDSNPTIAIPNFKCISPAAPITEQHSNGVFSKLYFFI